MDKEKKKKQRIIRRKIFNLFYYSLHYKFLDAQDTSQWVLRIPYSEWENVEIKNIETYWEYVRELEELIIAYEKEYNPIDSHGFVSYIRTHPEQDNWRINE